jgi:single-stranded-DNA-specific exonuclease
LFGDYDVDGTTAVSLVSSYLKPITLMLLPIFRIGMTKVTAFHLKELTLQMTMVFAYYRFRLCGIKSIDHVAYAKEKNIDFIICDHHRPGEIHPCLF